jgi:hypothetical protein
MLDNSEVCIDRLRENPEDARMYNLEEEPCALVENK